MCKTAKRVKKQVANYVKKIDWKKVAVTAGAIGVGIVLTVATGGLGAPVAMAIGGAASGAIMSGYDAYSSGQRGWALVGSIAKGAGLGAITGFVGGQFIGAGANVAANVTQNIANQTVRHVAKAGVEAGVETVIDTGISVATGNPISLKNVVTDYGLNLITNGSGSVSSKKSAKADVPKNKPKSGDVSVKNTKPSATVESPKDMRQRVLANIDASKKARDSSNFDEHLRREGTIKAIHNVENGTTPLKTNAQKGNYGEMKMDRYMEERGYTRVSTDRVTSIDAKGHQGIDGVYYHKGTDTYVVAEAKYNTAQLGKTQDGPQMGYDWIKNRLDDAVGADLADTINMNGYDSLLVRVMPDGSIRSKSLP
ncbi:hypothetical protein [Streptococcus himalayensis]|uniref:hypothetical protein n=1 Tax=Streptococcus himalayensis TaxID=1888195 RepID=UPI001CB9C0F8|nr:hypothetical protein [Streptococcus himalayensis]